MTIEQGPPPDFRSLPANWTELVEAIEKAKANPGEWFSVSVVDQDRRNIIARASKAIAKRIADVKLRGDRLYVRFLP